MCLVFGDGFVVCVFRSVKMDGVRVQNVLKEYNGPRYEIETQLMVFRFSIVPD